MCYLEETEDQVFCGKQKRRAANLEFEYMLFPESSSNLRQVDIMLLKTLINRKPDEELVDFTGFCCVFSALPQASKIHMVGLILKIDHFCLTLPLVCRY